MVTVTSTVPADSAGACDRDLRRRHDGDHPCRLAGPEIDGGGAGEVGARDGHARGAAQGSGVRADGCDRRHCRVGELVGARGGRGATGRRDRHVLRSRAGRRGDRDGSRSVGGDRSRRGVPNLTAVAFARLEPVTMTLVPPPAGTRGRADGSDRRCRRVGELVGTARRRGAVGGGHRHVDGGRRFGGCIDRDLRRRHDGDDPCRRGRSRSRRPWRR